MYFPSPLENVSEHDSETKLSKASVLPVLCGNVTRNPNSSSSSVKHPCPQTAEATNNSAVAQSDNKSNVQVCESKRNVCFPTSVLHNAAGKENVASSGTTYRTEMSIVASGLNQSEHVSIFWNVWRLAVVLNLEIRSYRGNQSYRTYCL